MNVLLSQLPARSRKIINQTIGAADALGLTVYLVGGAVRDLLLHRPVRDLDLAVEGDALTLARRLAFASGVEVLEPNPQFGTVTLLWPGGVRLDLAGTRSETYPAPAALPQVKPADIQTDLGRRDFSVNALALALNGPARGRLLDFYQGCEDLRKKRIRILHAQSFRDDPTRLFRAVRFEQRLGLVLEANTRREFKQALAQGRLKQLSGARILKELRLVLQADDYAVCLKRLARRGLLAQVNPGLQPLPGFLAANLEKVLALFNQQGPRKADNELLRFLALARALSRREFKSFLQRFPCPRAWVRALAWQQNQGVKFMRALAGRQGFSPAQWAVRLEAWPRENLLLLWALYPRAPWRRGLEICLKSWTQSKPVLTGEDLKLWGYAPGPEFGKILTALRAARLAGRVRTRADEKKYLRAHFSHKCKN